MATNVRRRDGVYWVRRRVPKDLVERLAMSEIHRSLRTSCPREAARRAAAAWLGTEALFKQMRKSRSTDAAQAKIFLDRLLAEPVAASETQHELLEAFKSEDYGYSKGLLNQAGVDQILGMGAEEQQHIWAHLQRLIDRMERYLGEHQLETANLGRAAAEWRADAAEEALVKVRLAAAEEGVARRVTDELRVLVTSREPSPKPIADMPLAPGGQMLISHCENEFFAAKRYPAHTEKQNRTTLRMWREVCGDLPTRNYTRSSAFEFQRALRSLPASHGKGNPKTIPEAIRAAEGNDSIPRLTETTIARHFSTLNQMWLHLGEEKVNLKIFDRIEHAKEEAQRPPWSEANLNLLLKGRWNPTGREGNRIAESTHAWLVALGGYTGARIEELARILVSDVQEIDGFWCFLIREHRKEGVGKRGTRTWTTKTDSGIRVIPIHPKLLEAGFLDVVVKRRADGEEFVFETNASGPGLKLSVEYSREFSRHKTRIKVDALTVFHSFRHNVETVLASCNLRQEWVDVFMGHSSGQRGARQSVGVKVYFHGLEPEILHTVARAVTYPIHVCPTLLIRRVRGEIPWYEEGAEEA